MIPEKNVRRVKLHLFGAGLSLLSECYETSFRDLFQETSTDGQYQQANIIGVIRKRLSNSTRERTTQFQLPEDGKYHMGLAHDALTYFTSGWPQLSMTTLLNTESYHRFLSSLFR